MSSAAVIIRAVERGDLQACAGIVNDYVDETTWLPRVYSREAVEGFFQDGFNGGRLMLLAERGGEIVGYLSAELKEAPALSHVHALYLKRDARGTGSGKALLDKAKALSPHGLELTVFEPNRAGQRFYKREGLREIPELRDDNTEEGVATLLFRWSDKTA